MKTIGSFMIAIFVIAIIVLVIAAAYASYDYSQNFQSYWSLSESASTLSLKSEYMDKYVSAVDSAHMDGEYAAIFFKTPQNSFDESRKVLGSLQQRLRECKDLKESDMAYQQAITQITAQEQ